MVSMPVPRDTILPDAPYWVDQDGDTWMGLPNGEFVMIGYRHGAVRWAAGAETATMRSLKEAGVRFGQPTTYTQAMVTILLKVINRFETSLRQANLI